MDTSTLATAKLTRIEHDIFATYADQPSSSLMCGNGALPLLYYKLYTLHQDDSYRQKAETILDSLLDQVNAGLPSLTFCDGLAGVAAMLSYLLENGMLGEGAEDFLAQCDYSLYQAFLKSVAQQDFDYLHGALGYAFYFLHRRQATSVVADTLGLVGEAILAHLERTRQPMPGQSVNCGMAHGQVSALMFLTKYLPWAPHPARVKSLLQTIVAQLLQYRSPDPTSPSQFPAIVRVQEQGIATAYTTPNGWCYGDTMLALGLLAASQALQDEALRAEAIAIALCSTQRNTPAKAIIVDGGVCHGSAGLAHMYSKWYQATGHAAFQDSYHYWIDQTLALSNHADGLGGFRKNMGGSTYATTYGLLDGACGVGLVLADFLAGAPSSWDRFLALS